MNESLGSSWSTASEVRTANYSVTCECGVLHPVSATQAGSTLTCRCGRPVDVPPLSSLRKSAGESPVPLNTIERIRAMIRSGELPSGDVCPYSGRRADDTMLFHIQCERTWVRGSGEWGTGKIVIYVWLLGLIGALIASLKSGPREELGRDISLEVPVRISADARPKLIKMRRQKTLKALLCETPIYSQLLQEFPGATIMPLRIA